MNISDKSFASKPLAPGLYVTATPIGNLGDMTFRAVETLQKADLILCEDTRVTGKLAQAFDIKTPLKPYHDHNGDRVRPFVLEALAQGKAIALVSDAGTPLIADPGFKLVRAAREAGHKVVSVPGACALTAALSIAGLPTDEFIFAGFLPPKSGARKKQLTRLISLPATIAVYESGPRLPATLTDIAALAPDRHIAIAREITKLHEEVVSGTAIELATLYADKTVKGEIVLLIHGHEQIQLAAADIETLLREALQSQSVKDAAAGVAQITGQPKSEVYALALKLKQDLE